MNTCISKLIFLAAWIARISAIPKTSEVKTNNDLTSISILPMFSNIYQRLVRRQLSTTFFGLSTYSKEHNTTTVLLAMRDDILRATQREVTIAVLADYSKAFDTVAYETVLRKLHGLGFSKVYLRWTVSYLTGRKQFVQMDGKTSRQIEVTFGVLQGSILGPVLFNLYVNAFQPAWVLLSHTNTLMTLQPISMRNPLSLACDPPFM